MNKNVVKMTPNWGFQHPVRLWIGVLVVLLCLPLPSWAVKPADVRTIIDISGSMKKNDPHNLRKPALRLLVSLMPDGTRAGVWTFGQYVNMAVKWGKVDDAWKAAALKAADKIGSPGQHTNIEEALRRATKGWEKPDPHHRRHLVLLTDGFVDISKDPAVNAESRRRILQEVLPGLEKSDVTIHSIALSKNVDFELLYALSGATDGWYERVDDASQLPRVFLRIFENAVIPDALPLKNNRFKVDKSVSDVTVLLFRKDDKKETTLLTPDNKSMTVKTHPKTVTWQHEKNYDLINIKQPQTGEWNIKADVDPDNRVLIVTNLKLAVDTLPTNLMLGDQIDVKARLQEKNKTLVRQDLLKLLHFKTIMHVANRKQDTAQPMMDNGKGADVLAKDGVYSTKIQPLNVPGKYEVIVQVSGGVLEREYRHTMNVFDTAASIDITENKDHFTLKITPYAGLLRTETVSMQVQLPDGKTVNFQQVDDTSWSANIPKAYANKTATIVLTGTRYNRQSLTQKFAQLIAVTKGEQPLKLAPVIQAVKAPVTAQKIADSKPAGKNETEKKKTSPHAAAKKEKDFNWTFVIILIVAINALVAVGGVAGYIIWKKRRVTQLAEEDKDMAL